MNKEYEALILLFAQIIFDKAEEQEKEAYKQQRKDQDEFLSSIAKVLLTYTIVDNVLSITDTEKAKITQNLNTIINNIAVNQYKAEKELMKDILSTVVEDKYYTSSYIMNLGINFKLQTLTNKKINELVNETIDGEIWSERLWDNKKLLEKKLKLQSKMFLQGKVSVNDIEKVVKDTFNSNSFNTRRLVQTEVARCQSEANNLFAKEHGVEEQMYSATLNSKVSDFCKSRDGNIYKINDPRKPIPGKNTHPFCRSVLINVPFKGWKPKVRLDNETKQQIDYKTYQEWLKDKEIKK